MLPVTRDAVGTGQPTAEPSATRVAIRVGPVLGSTWVVEEPWRKGGACAGEQLDRRGTLEGPRCCEHVCLTLPLHSSV